MVAPYTFRPAVRENTPLVIGISGPTKSGKTYSALRIAAGLAPKGPVVMLNAEGQRGHQYADRFKYLTCDLVPPYRYTMYQEALVAAAAMATRDGVVIVDSMSHAHDGPGGALEWHEAELDRIAGKTDYAARQRANFAGWIVPKQAENAFRYALLEIANTCPVILCMRAKEKLKIVPGQQPVNLGWQPIVGESIEFETIFTLTLPPYSKGVPDLAISGLREPFDKLIPAGKPIDEDLGKVLTEWAKGRAAAVTATLLEEVQAQLVKAYPGQSAEDKDAKAALLVKAFGSRSWAVVKGMDADALRAGLTKLTAPAEVRSTPAPAATVTPPTEPEPAYQAEAFPTRAALKPAPASTVQVPGIDVDDPSQVLVKAIEEEKAKLERQPSDEQWAAVCKGIAGTEVLDMADPDQLKELLELVKGLVAGDEAAVERAGALIRPKGKGAGQ